MNDDWRDLLAALSASGARYLIVGAHAMAVHGVPRGTQDLDIWIGADPGNAGRVWDALLSFGAPLADLAITRDDLSRRDTVVQLGLPPARIDLLTGLSGLASFDEAWQSRVMHEFGPVSAPFLDRASLIRTKRASGRRKDLADLEALGELPPS
jgi:hypothetical protein